jgi:hypothetical protein
MYRHTLNRSIFVRRFPGMALLALSIWSGAALAQVTGSGTAEHVALWKNGTTLENAPWRIEANATSPSLIGGYSGNTVATGVAGAVIGGGGESRGVNSVTFEFSTVGGGMLNAAGGTLNGAAVVSGGEFNQACGDSTTVAGGYRNVAGDAYGGGLPGRHASSNQRRSGPGTAPRSWRVLAYPLVEMRQHFGPCLAMAVSGFLIWKTRVREPQLGPAVMRLEFHGDYRFGAFRGGGEPGQFHQPIRLDA